MYQIEPDAAVKGTNMLNALKTIVVGMVLAVVLAGAGLLASAPSPTPVGATPDAILGLNSSNCVALGIAFGGLEARSAVFDCLALGAQDQTDSITSYVKCLRGQDVDHNGTHKCSSDPVGKIVPGDFKALDLDKNQVYSGQRLIILAFVNSDVSVRFTTDLGQLSDTSFNSPIGKEYTCNTGASTPPPPGDPDCDGDPATVGDGVVAVALTVQKSDGTGTGHVTAIQNGVGIPMTFTVTGRPDTIEVKPLFGKDTIQTGATAPPPAFSGTAAVGSPDVTNTQLLPTDCAFVATASGVLGANNQAEKAVLVVTAKDNDGVPVVGALLNWDHPFVHANDATGTLGTPAQDPLPQGGVALQNTPTIDTGPLGVAFPQFVCGGKVPGELPLKVRFTNLLDGGASDVSTFVNVTVHVVGPPATIALAADPPTVVCDGKTASKVTVTAMTAAGVPVADGADAKFSVAVLGSANPLTANTSKGVASTMVTPLSAANTDAAGAKGVPVIVTVGDVQSSILVKCSDAAAAAPPPAGGGAPAGGAAGGGAAPAGGGQTGTIRGPDTGSGFAGSAGALSWWPALALVGAALTLVGVNRFAFKREE